jgi:hypothetical protein
MFWVRAAKVLKRRPPIRRQPEAAAALKASCGPGWQTRAGQKVNKIYGRNLQILNYEKS